MGNQSNLNKSSLLNTSKHEIDRMQNFVARTPQTLEELEQEKNKFFRVHRQIVQLERILRFAYLEAARKPKAKFHLAEEFQSSQYSIETNTAANQDRQNRELFDQLVALERQKQQIEVMMRAIDQVILRVKSYQIKRSLSEHGGQQT